MLLAKLIKMKQSKKWS